MNGVKVYGYRDRNGTIRYVTLSESCARMNARLNGGTVVCTVSTRPDCAVSATGAHWSEA